MNRNLLAAALCLFFQGPVICQSADGPVSQSAAPEKAVSEAADSIAFRPLSDDWEAASFGGDGAIEFKTIEVKASSEEGAKPKEGKASKTQLIEMAMGDPLTGIRWTGPLIRDHYELRLQARRVEGVDFFVAITFPLGEEHCSFVVGGWGGGILGISNIDGNDAANNETTQYKDFKTGQWYTFRVRVDKESVKCWIDDEEYVSVNRDDHSFDIRIEMDPCLPLGIANFQCVSEIKGVAIRNLSTDAK